MHTWHCPTGDLRLGRHPYDGLDPALFAWNGADTLLAGQLAGMAPGHRVLLLNDRFGALAGAALQAGCLVRWQSDSWLARLACRENLAANSLPADGLELLDSLSFPDPAKWRPDLVLMQLPKSKLFLEFQLEALARCLPSGTPVCAGGMTRDVHTAGIALFEQWLGPTRTSLAAHKARLIHATAARRSETAAAWPRTIALDEPGLPKLEICNHAGVFSASGHDRGSLLLLRWLADGLSPEGVGRIIDCGCGNGLLSLVAAKLFPAASLVCADESWMALASARAGFERNGMGGRAGFAWTDCLAGLEPASADLVLCNPPFHHQQTQTLSIALRMFEHAATCLRPSGRLAVVANRHLGYRSHLEKWFPLVRMVGEDASYQVLLATREA